MKPTFDLHGRGTTNPPIWENYEESQEREDAKISSWDQGTERDQKVSKINRTPYS